MTVTRSFGGTSPLRVDRANDAEEILAAVQGLILPRIRAADAEATDKAHSTGSAPAKGASAHPVLVERHAPDALEPLLNLSTPSDGLGRKGLLAAASTILRYSVNTWDRGFLDKLYSSNDPEGLAADLLLSALNTNVHVFSVAPALTLVEKHTASALAALFGLRGPHAGGVTVPGGAASNYTAMLVARNFMFPEVKTRGVSAFSARPPAVFTSEVAHYSVSVAAAQLGLGSDAVYAVRVRPSGAMDPGALAEAVQAAERDGRRPFFACATAGTTVRGAYDPLREIAAVCARAGAWLHVDACWGGGAAFSDAHRGRLDGAELASSISFNPHKMLGVPLTTTFLLGADMRTFHAANSLDAGYLFHGAREGGGRGGGAEGALAAAPAWRDVHDLATLVPQCGRRGDALKMYLAWQVHGTAGLGRRVDAAFAAARRLAAALQQAPGVELVGDAEPECCQVCFRCVGRAEQSPEHNSLVTRAVVEGLVARGWMVDYTSHPDGEHLRVVCNRDTSDEIVDALVRAVVSAGKEAVAGI